MTSSGADQPQVLAHQLVGHVGIGLFGVEQRRMVPKLRFLLLELGEFYLSFRQRAVIAAPGKDAIGAAGNGRRRCRPRSAPAPAPPTGE